MRIFAVIFGLILPLLACAEDAPVKPKFIEGEHYQVLAGAPKPAKTGNIEVTEFYWYGCGHCYSFEPLIAEWRKGLASDVSFTQSPAMWKSRNPENAMWIHAKLYYTAKALGQLEKLHPVFFDAMHVKHKKLVNNDEIAALVTAQGLDGDAFVKTMDSFAVNAQVTLADSRQREAKVTGTPEMTVGGYYHISTGPAGGQKGMLEVANFLIDKIRNER